MPKIFTPNPSNQNVSPELFLTWMDPIELGGLLGRAAHPVVVPMRLLSSPYTFIPDW